jgi:peptidyl-prolyl cis-trans isomerase A (cyclophilin A)
MCQDYLHSLLVSACCLVVGVSVQAEPFAPVQPSDDPAELIVGSQVPPLVGTRIHGTQIDKLDPARVYVIEFWEEWCSPCKRSMPSLIRNAQENPDVGVIAVQCSEAWDESRTKAYLSQLGGADRVCFLRAPELRDTLFQPLGFDGFPSAVVIAKGGRVEWKGHPMNLPKGLLAECVARPVPVAVAVDPLPDLGSCISGRVPGNAVAVSEAFEVIRWSPSQDLPLSSEDRVWFEKSRLPWWIRHRKLGLDLVLIPPGTSQFGASASERAQLNELADLLDGPAKATFRSELAKLPAAEQVQRDAPFYISKSPVSSGQLERIEGGGGGAQAYPPNTFAQCGATSWIGLLQRVRSECAGIRFPTEREWEYACRARSAALYWWGETPLSMFALQQKHPWGLRGMSQSQGGDQYGRYDVGELCVRTSSGSVDTTGAVPGKPEVAEPNGPSPVLPAGVRDILQLAPSETANLASIQSEANRVLGVTGVMLELPTNQNELRALLGVDHANDPESARWGLVARGAHFAWFPKHLRTVCPPVVAARSGESGRARFYLSAEHVVAARPNAASKAEAKSQAEAETKDVGLAVDAAAPATPDKTTQPELAPLEIGPVGVPLPDGRAPSSGRARASIEFCVFYTSIGTIVAELYRDKSPVTVENFIAYIDSGFYKKTVIHRVVPELVIQCGGYDIEGKLKETRAPIKNEWQNGLKNTRGTLSMARTQAADSATSQFFFNLKDNAAFDRPASGGAGYAVFGKVIGGMNVIDEIAKSRCQRRNGASDWPVKDIVVLEAAVITSDRAIELCRGAG